MIGLLWVLLSSIAVFAAGYILPGIEVKNFGTAIVVAVVLGLLNTFIRPLLIILTIPINILTLGLFTLVIMAGLVMLTSMIVPGFVVHGFWWAMAFALVMTLINSFLQNMV